MRLIKPSRSLKPMGLAIKSKTISKKVLADIVDKIEDIEHPFFINYFKNLFLLSYETGARISEIICLHETDLDLKYGVVHYVVRKKLKKPMETSKHLTPELLERLREHTKQYKFQIEHSGSYIFFGMSSKTKHITVRTAERHFEMARDSAGHGTVYGQSKMLYKIINISNKPQTFNLYGKVEQEGKEVEIIIKKITILPNESTTRAIDPERYKTLKHFKIKEAGVKSLRRCTIHSIRHLSLQTVLEEKGLFEAYDHADHVSITSTMSYLDANPKKRQSRSEVFRSFYGREEEDKPKAHYGIRENIPAGMDLNNMANIFSQMAQFLSTMQGQNKEQKLSEEFNAMMKMKAEQEHKNTFAHATTQ
ncbi:site-specific integrase [Candidatus Woesearchaeota archaeon]|nr:site-specific integrase [Candidatus Woesearchaeota archaeon]